MACPPVTTMATTASRTTHQVIVATEAAAPRVNSSSSSLVSQAAATGALPSSTVMIPVAVRATGEADQPNPRAASARRPRVRAPAAPTAATVRSQLALGPSGAPQPGRARPSEYGPG